MVVSSELITCVTPDGAVGTSIFYLYYDGQNLIPDSTTEFTFKLSCAVNYYIDPVTHTQCYPCPDGASCEGGVSAPSARAGYTASVT